MTNNMAARQPALPLRRDTYLVERTDSELVGRLVRIYRTYAFSLSSHEQQEFRQMIRMRYYKRGDGLPDPSNVTLHHAYHAMYHRRGRFWMGDKVTFAKWALLATLYSAESLSELAKVVVILGIDRRPCWQEYADHHDGDDEKGDDNLRPLQLPNAAELAAGWTKTVRISAAPLRAASGSDADEVLPVANDTKMQPPNRYSLSAEQQDFGNHDDAISGRIPSDTSHGELERSFRRRKHSLRETELASPQPASKRRACHSDVSYRANASVYSPSRTVSQKSSNFELPPGSDDAALIWQEIARLHQGLDSITADNIALRKKVDASEADNIALRQKVDASEADNIALRQKVDASEADNIALRQKVDASEADSIALRKILDELKAELSAQDIDKALLRQTMASVLEQTQLLLQRVDKLEESHKSYSSILGTIYKDISVSAMKTDELAESNQNRDQALLKAQVDVEECRTGLEECQAGVEECHKVVEGYRADLEQCRSCIEDCHKVVEECQADMEEGHKVVEIFRTGLEECQVSVGKFPAYFDRVKADFRRIVETRMRESDDGLAKELRDSIASHRKDTTRSLRDMNQKVQKALEETKRLAKQCSDENLQSMARKLGEGIFELVGGIIQRGPEDRD